MGEQIIEIRYPDPKNPGNEIAICQDFRNYAGKCNMFWEITKPGRKNYSAETGKRSEYESKREFNSGVILPGRKCIGSIAVEAPDPNTGKT